MKSLLVFLISIGFVNANVTGEIIDGIFCVTRGATKVAPCIIDGGQILKVGKLSKISVKMLQTAKMEKNIKNLMKLAAKEHRLKFYSDQFTYAAKYKNFKNGDKLLLKCLKESSCSLEKYTNIIKNPPTPLHYKLILKNPSLSLPQLNIKVGTINENLMNKYFQSTGWTKIEGEVGRNGIDGLFLKRKNGVIIDVLVVESKYNKSGLQHTQHGQQMTKQWVSKKVDNLISQYPKNRDYVMIKKYVNNDIYRAMLWNMKTTDESLLITLKHIHDKAGKAVSKNITGSSKMKINYQGNQKINIKNPKNDFHKEFANLYEAATK